MRLRDAVLGVIGLCIAFAPLAQGSAVEDETLLEARRELSEARARYGEDALEVAEQLDRLAFLNLALGRYPKAEALARRALAIRRRQQRDDHPDLAISLNQLGEIARRRGDLDEAEVALREAVRILDREHRGDHPDLATALSNLAGVYVEEDRLDEGERAYRRALEIARRHASRGDTTVPRIRRNLAGLHAARGALANAEPLLRQALGELRDALGAENVEVAYTLANLADLRYRRGDPADAAALAGEALPTLESALGLRHRDVAAVLSSLASYKLEEGRPEEAAPLLQRALAIQQDVLEPDSSDTAGTLTTLATLYYAAGQFESAIAAGERALAIRRAVFGTSHRLYAESLRSVAEAQRAAGNVEGAHALLGEALEILSQRDHGRSIDILWVLIGLAAVERDLGRFALARERYARALEIADGLLDVAHPVRATAYRGLARLHLADGDLDAAVDAIRRASTIDRSRLAQGSVSTRDAEIVERRRLRGQFLLHADIVWEMLERGRGRAAELREELFELSQLLHASSAARALSKMGARFAAANSGLERTLHAQQEDVEQLGSLSRTLLARVSSIEGGRDLDAERGLRASISSLRKRLAERERLITAQFPRYAELMSPSTHGVLAVQRLLDAGEALVSFVVGEEHGYALALTHEALHVRRLRASRAELQRLVLLIRASVDITGADSPSDLPPFPVQAAHALFLRTLGPVYEVIGDVDHVLVIGDGPLQNIPLSLLVLSPSTLSRPGFDEYRRTTWLVRRQSVTVLPSVGALPALRTLAGRSRASRAMVGFGNPAFDGPPGETRRIAAATFFVGTRSATTTADDALRRLPRLPDTERELRRLLLSLGDGDLYLGESATESAVKNAALDRFRVVVFATHGLVAGDFSGTAEAALALTPPAVPGEHDDGLLTSSEVTALHLDADWVILSACNTAAPGAIPGAEGLSGLARAFFFAGARALLVSHWSIASSATVRLTTGAFDELSRDKRMTKTEALRRAMLGMLDDQSAPYHAHPAYWAPMALVGDGR